MPNPLIPTTKLLILGFGVFALVYGWMSQSAYSTPKTPSSASGEATESPVEPYTSEDKLETLDVVSIGTPAIVTAYTHTGNLTAAGTVPEVGTVACPRYIPLHTKILIDGKEYTCMDRTHQRFDGRYDIFVETYNEAIHFGKQKLNVEKIN